MLSIKSIDDILYWHSYHRLFLWHKLSIPINQLYKVHGDRSKKLRSIYIPDGVEMCFNTSNLADSWNRYRKAFYLYSDATDLSKKGDSVKIWVFLHCIGEQGQTVYENIFWDTDGDNKVLSKVLEKFEVEFNRIKTYLWAFLRVNDNYRLTLGDNPVQCAETSQNKKRHYHCCSLPLVLGIKKSVQILKSRNCYRAM